MAEIAVTPIVMNDSIIEIDDDDFAAAISSAVFTPTSSTVTFAGLKPTSRFTGQTPTTWVLALTFAVDIATAGSLSNYLHEHEGDEVAASFKPQSGIGPSVEALIIITPGAIGGAAGTVPTATVNLGVNGKPEIVAAP